MLFDDLDCFRTVQQSRIGSVFTDCWTMIAPEIGAAPSGRARVAKTLGEMIFSTCNAAKHIASRGS